MGPTNMLIYALLLATPMQSAACTTLSNKYEDASKTLAILFVEGANDNSAPRATMREAREGNIRQEARDTLDLMKAHGCELPIAAPNAGPYVVQAMKCHLDETKNTLANMRGQSTTTPISCDISTWVNNRK